MSDDLPESQPESHSAPPSDPRPVEPREAAPAQPAPAALAKPAAHDGPSSGRRGFFANALREVITPVAGLLEKRIQPVLAAIENLPDDLDRLTGSAAPRGAAPLDQPQSTPRHLALPQSHHSRKTLPDRYLRPPGAMQPGQFEQVCSTCGACVAACPAGAIQLDPEGLAGDGFPYLVPREQPCVVCESLACMKSCPSGALKLVDRLAIRLGTATVDPFMCLRNSGEECTLCIDVCPVGREFGDQPALIISVDTGRIRVRKNICIGCGLCESRCPTEPAAITITPLKTDHHIIIA